MTSLSILITTFSEPRLCNSLLSIVNQVKPEYHLQIFVHEGGNTDKNSKELIERYPHLITYSCFPDRSLYDGMNHLIKCSSSDYCMILNSDDQLAVDALPLIFHILHCAKAPCYSFDVSMVNNKNSMRSFSSRAQVAIARKHPWLGMPFPHGGFICSSQILKENLFDLSIGLSADYHQILNIISDGYDVFDCSSISIQLFDQSGASSTKYFFSSRNPHYLEIKAIYSSRLPFLKKVVGIVLRLIKILLLAPFKLLA